MPLAINMAGDSRKYAQSTNSSFGPPKLATAGIELHPKAKTYVPATTGDSHKQVGFGLIENRQNKCLL